jgi:hypothetical protein
MEKETLFKSDCKQIIQKKRKFTFEFNEIKQQLKNISNQENNTILHIINEKIDEVFNLLTSIDDKLLMILNREIKI